MIFPICDFFDSCDMLLGHSPFFLYFCNISKPYHSCTLLLLFLLKLYFTMKHLLPHCPCPYFMSILYLMLMFPCMKNVWMILDQSVCSFLFWFPYLSLLYLDNKMVKILTNKLKRSKVGTKFSFFALQYLK